MKMLRQLMAKLLLVALVLGLGLVIYMDALVSTTFENRQWETPARVYSRPLELFPGRRLALEELQYELSLLGYREVSSLTQPGQMQVGRNRLDFYARGFRFPDETVPAARLAVSFSGSKVTAIKSGTRTLELARLEPVHIGGIYPRHREDRLLLQLDNVPDTMVAGLLAMEDRQFYSHWGISVSGIARAVQANYQAGRVVQGGSTITQQLVKNYYLSSERSLWRKAQEAMMALLLEFHFEKSAILEGYINEVFLSQDGPRAIHGFGLASEYFFDRSLAELGIHQQALLVGMVKGPSLYNPLRNPERARGRRDIVLDVMFEQGIINDAEHAVALAMPLGVSKRTRVVNSYPAYLALVRRQLRRDYHEQDLGSLGLSIFTGFDPLLQRQAERSVATVLPGLKGSDQLETALVVTSFDNGEVKALLGGRKPRYAGFNRALDAVRPVGSLIKPAVYLTALQDPSRYTLATPLSDAAVTVAGANGTDWQPRNFDLQSHGTPLLHEALAQSYNQATARLGMQVSIDAVLETMRRLGVEREQPRVPSLVLGAGGLAPIDIAAMYQTIAAGGFRLPLHTIRDVVDARGKIVQRYPLHYEREVSIQAIHLLHYALREVMEEGTGKSVSRYLPPGFAVAGKTGTTNDNRDSWFAGFSGDLMAVSWVGRDDNGDTGLTGATGALKIWGEFMRTASRVPLAYRVPEGIEHYWVDPVSGELSAEDCEGARLIPFISGSQPQKRVDCAQRKDRIMEWFRDLF